MSSFKVNGFVCVHKGKISADDQKSTLKKRDFVSFTISQLTSVNNGVLWFCDILVHHQI